MKKLKYQRQLTRETGTREQPQTETYLQDESLYASDSNYVIQMATAVACAYNGEVTVEEIPDKPQEPTQLDRIEAQSMYTALMTNTMLEEST